MRLVNSFVASVLMIFSAAGCADSGTPETIGVTQQAAAPPAPVGASAALVSNNLPGLWAPDERRVVSVTMNNNGTTTWAPTGPTYALGSLQPTATWAWAYTPVTSSVSPGANHTFNFVVTAPSAAMPTIANFSARTRTLSTQYFGATLGPTPQTVDPAATPLWGCELIADDVPMNMTPGERRLVTFTLQNSGSGTWPANGLLLDSRDTVKGFWGQTSTALPSGAVAPGGAAVVSFTITAPTAIGTYSLAREIFDSNPGSVGLFKTRSPFCVAKSIAVGGAAQLNATVVANTFPTTMVVDDVAIVTVTMNNTGTEAWQDDGNYALYSANSPASLWGVTSTAVPTITNNGQQAVFSFTVRAPAAGGNYAQTWRMRKFSGASAGYFGDTVNVAVTVSAMGTPNYGATVTGQTIPLLVTAGSNQTFAIAMENSGSTAWSGSTFQLYSANSPQSLWQTLSSPLGAMETIANGASRVFNLNVIAPPTAGTYSSSWRMRQSPGVGSFGATALTANIQVTLCGNNAVDAGEQCDDANLTNGDGCSQTCQWEQTEIDLATTTPDRGIRGSQANGQINAVTIGDVTGDAVPELLLSQRSTPTAFAPARTACGAVYGLPSGGSFFTDATTTLANTDAGFIVVGATGGDQLGLAAGGWMVVGDVTGDGTGDLIVSAPQADGLMDLRSNSGEVYVLAGGPSLATAGVIDLNLIGSMTPPAAVTAHIFGRNANDQLAVLAAGDITGDGTGDLVLGAPGDTVGGALAGVLYIVEGPIVGDIDLTPPVLTNNVYTITGAVANNLLGNNNAVIGDIDGDSNFDLLFGVPRASPSLTSQGAAYAFFGPIGSDLTLADADVTWIGHVANANFGQVVAIGNVTGTVGNEVVISGTQIKSGGVQYGGVTVWSGVAAGTYDMSLGATATSLILGADANDNCGTAMALGLIDGDGYDDIAIGCGIADGATNAGDRIGEVHVVLGGTLPATYDFNFRPSRLVFYGAANLDRLGNQRQSVAVGDLDGDGRADICGGALFAGGSGPPSLPGELYCIESSF